MASLPNPNPIPNQGLLQYSYTIDPTKPNVTNSVLSNIVYAQVNIASVSIVKSINLGYAKNGDVLQYTIIATNTGNINATNVIIQDTIPSGLNFVAGSVQVNSVANAGNINTGITIPNISVNGVATIVFNVQVNTVPINNPINNQGNIVYSYMYDPSTPKSNVASGISNIVPVTINQAIINGNNGNIVKSVDKEYSTLGDTITYTINISNSGNISANNVILNDTLAQSISFVPGSVYVNGINQPSANISQGINIGSVGVGNSVGITFEAVVNTVPNPNQILNNAYVNYQYTMNPSNVNGISDGGISNNVVTTINYVTFSNTGIIKSVNLAQATLGDTVTYTIVLQNLGNTTANNVIFKDTIPQGTSFVSNSVYLNGGNLIGGNPSIGIPLGSIVANGVNTIQFTVQVNTIPNQNIFKNQGSVGYNFTINPANPNGGSNTDWSNVVQTQVNYSGISGNGLVKTVDKNFASIGDTVTYTIYLKNSGNVNANNVIFYDTIPSQLSLVSNSITVDSIVNGGNLVNGISIGTITPNQLVVVKFSGIVTAIPSNNILNNTADVGYDFQVNGVNRNYRNTTNIVTTTVVYTNIISVKVANKNYANLGDTIGYTVTIVNTGNSPSNNTIIKDSIPVGTNFVSNSVSLNGVNVPGADVTQGYNIGSINPNQIQTITFNVLVQSIPSNNPIYNNINVNYQYTVDPTSSPRPGTSTGVSGPVTISNANFNSGNNGIVKSVNKGYASIGDTLIYSFILTNLGNTIANNVVLIDTVPQNTSFVSNSVIVSGQSAQGSPSSGISLGNIDVGQSVTVSFNVIVNSTLPSTALNNRGSVNYNYTVDPTQNNVNRTDSSNIVTTTLSVAIIDGNSGGIVKAVDKIFTTKNDTLTYTVTLRNTGNTVATGVTVYDTIPFGTQFISNTFSLNGNIQPGIDITNPLGVNIGNLQAGSVATLQFKVLVVTVPTPNTLINNMPVKYYYTTDPAILNGRVGGSISNNVTSYVNYGSFNNSQGGIIKYVDVSEATLGSTITYTVVLENIGNTTANNVVFKDTIPNGTTFITSSVKVNGANQSTANPQSGVLIGSIAPLEVVTVTFNVLVNSIVNTNTIPNTASVGYNYTINPSVQNGGVGNDSSNTVLTTIKYANIGGNTNTFVKQANYSNVQIGQNIVYTLVAINNGNTAADNVVIQDTVPSGTSFVSNSILVNNVLNGGDIQSGISLGSLQPGQRATITFVVTVNSIPVGNVIKNTANVSYNFIVNGTTITKNNPSTETDTNAINGKMSISKITSSNYADLNSTITYSILAENIGNTTIANAFLKDTVPVGTSFIPNSVQVDGNVMNGVDIASGYNIGSLGVGVVKTITFSVLVVSIPISNPIQNTIGGTYSYLVDPSLPMVTSTTITTSNMTTINNANFNSLGGGLEKSSDKIYTTVGDTITYTIKAMNLGNVQSNNTVVIDTLPTNIQFIQGSTTIDGASTSGDPNLGIHLGSIQPNQTITVQFLAKVLSVTPTSIINNKAIIDYDYTVDPSKPPVLGVDGSNNSTAQINYASLNVNKIASTSIAYLNQQIIYTMQISNSGNVDAKNVYILDTLPIEARFVTGTVILNGINLSSTNITTGITIPTIKANSTSILTFGVVFNSIPRGGMFTNQAIANYSYTVDPSLPDVAANTASNPSNITVAVYISPSKVVNNNKCPGVTIPNIVWSGCNKLQYTINNTCTEAQKVKIGKNIRQYAMWKQEAITQKLDLEIQNSNISEIDNLSVNINFVQTTTIATPNTNGVPSCEGEILTGRKLAIEGILSYTIQIIKITGEIVKKVIDKPFSLYVVVGSSYLNTVLQANGCVEDIKINSICTGVISVTTSLLIYLLPGGNSNTNGGCGSICSDDCSGEDIEKLSISNICPNISSFLMETERNWKEINVEYNLNNSNGEILEILKINGDIKIIDYKIISTPVVIQPNNEGLGITGSKMLINAILKVKLNYSSGSMIGQIKRMNLNIPISGYIVMNCVNAQLGITNYDIKTCIEDIFVCNLKCSEDIFISSNIIMKATPCVPTNCN